MKQEKLAVALQQWLDVLLAYDLTIKYRPGILHIIPDALSRMYLQAYDDPAIVWGTKSPWTFLDVPVTFVSPSDRLCVESMPPTSSSQSSSVKRRHRRPRTQTGEGGKGEKFDSATTDPPIVTYVARYDYGYGDESFVLIYDDDRYDFEMSDECGALVNAMTTRSAAHVLDWSKEMNEKAPLVGSPVSVNEPALVPAPSSQAESARVNLPPPPADDGVSTSSNEPSMLVESSDSSSSS
jgi:hypothetical protein